jgi:hypothetical protein
MPPDRGCTVAVFYSSFLDWMVLNLTRVMPNDVHIATEAHGIYLFFRAFRVIPWLFIRLGA